MAASALIALSGCASNGGSVGYHAFTRASDADMPTICEEFFGSAESIGKRVDLTLYEGDMVGGVCAYETNIGGNLGLSIAETEVENATLYARGEKYFAALAITDAEGNDAGLATDKRESLTKWLELRANAVEDDYDEWLADLPAVDAGYVASNDFSLEGTDSADPKSLSGTLYTPSAEVYVSSLITPNYLYVNETETAPAKDEKFIVAGVTITQYDDMQVDPEYAITFDGQPAGEAADKALPDVIHGASSQIALSVPQGVKDVELVVTTGDSSQAVSLLTGEVKDSGESVRLASRKSSRGDGEITLPDVNRENGRTNRLYGYFAAYEREVSWSLSPWSATDGWAPEGESYFDLTLTPNRPELVAALTAADATVTINGTQFTAQSFDPVTYAFRFLIPEGVNRISTQVRFTLPLNQAGYNDAVSYTGPVMLDNEIDPNHIVEDDADW